MATLLRPASIKLDEDLRDRIKRLADAVDRTPHYLMREAIDQYVEREEKRLAFNHETMNAWEDYKATGLHTTQAEVRTWLESWGTDDELPPPVCHK